VGGLIFSGIIVLTVIVILVRQISQSGLGVQVALLVLTIIGGSGAFLGVLFMAVDPSAGTIRGSTMLMVPSALIGGVAAWFLRKYNKAKKLGVPPVRD
jgi:hypothetical protein